MPEKTDTSSSLWGWPFGRRRQEVPDFLQHYLETPRPDDNVHWREVSYCVLDMETTGLNAKRDSVVAMGLVTIENGRIQLNEQWYTLVRPARGVVSSVESMRIHGLLHRDVADAPAFLDVLPELLDRLRERVLIVHFAPIDVAFLNQALRRIWGVAMRGPAIDTVLLAQALQERQRWTDSQASYNPTSVTSLSELATMSNLPIHGEHNALGDALTTAQLFLAQATRMEKYGFDTLRRLLRAGRCLR